MSGPWEGLSPPYSTIVADPPWHYEAAWHGGNPRTDGHRALDPKLGFPYSTMSLPAILDLPVRALAAADSHLYLWTTNRYLRSTYDVAEEWGFTPSTVLVWCKPPMGIGPGGAYSITTEFVLYARRGSLAPLSRADTTWIAAPRAGHSAKPAAFGDLVERVSPGPYVELFARQPRLGWDSWGLGHESGAA